MAHSLGTNEIHVPLAVTIDGHSLVCGEWKATAIDAEYRPYFKDFRRDIPQQSSPEEQTTEITLVFTGGDSVRIRTIMANALSRARAEGT